MNKRQIYIRTVLNLYTHTPGIALPARRSDRDLADSFFDREIPISIIEAALLLASVRRISRRTAALPAIRSLHYFQPIVEELMAQPPPPGYVAYLRLKLRSTAEFQLPVSADRQT